MVRTSKSPGRSRSPARAARDRSHSVDPSDAIHDLIGAYRASSEPRAESPRRASAPGGAAAEQFEAAFGEPSYFLKTLAALQDLIIDTTSAAYAAAIQDQHADQKVIHKTATALVRHLIPSKEKANRLLKKAARQHREAGMAQQAVAAALEAAQIAHARDQALEKLQADLRKERDTAAEQRDTIAKERGIAHEAKLAKATLERMVKRMKAAQLAAVRPMQWREGWHAEHGRDVAVPSNCSKPTRAARRAAGDKMTKDAKAAMHTAVHQASRKIEDLMQRQLDISVAISSLNFLNPDEASIKAEVEAKTKHVKALEEEKNTLSVERDRMVKALECQAALYEQA